MPYKVGDSAYYLSCSDSYWWSVVIAEVTNDGYIIDFDGIDVPDYAKGGLMGPYYFEYAKAIETELKPRAELSDDKAKRYSWLITVDKWRTKQLLHFQTLFIDGLAINNEITWTLKTPFQTDGIHINGLLISVDLVRCTFKADVGDNHLTGLIGDIHEFVIVS